MDGSNMKLLTPKEIEAMARELFNKIPAKEDCRFNICFNHTEAWNTEIPLAEVDNGYHYKFYERGKLTTDKNTFDIEELLYWIFEPIIFSAACSYEVNNRVPNQDFRRLLFEKEAELFRYIGECYVSRHEKHVETILKKAPYDDNL